MGFHDDVFCKHPLGEGRLAAGEAFQTKMPGRGGEQFTISPEGRLIRHLVRYDWSKEPGGHGFPLLTRIPVGFEDTEFHGDLVLYGYCRPGALEDFVARFTYETLESLEPLAEVSEARRQMLEVLVGGG